MKKLFVLIWGMALLAVLFGTNSYCGTPQQEPSEALKAKVQKSFGNLPLSFIENVGQTNEKVAYYLKGRQGTIYFTREGMVYDLISAAGSTTKKTNVRNKEGHVKKMSRLSFTIKPEGVKKDVKLTAKERLPGRVNYLTGKDPRKWCTSIPLYKSILYEGLYQDIDLKVYGTNNQMEYDFIVHPGGDPNDIMLTCEGIKGLEIDKVGNLVIMTLLREVKHLKPTIYQKIDGKRCSVEGSFRVAKNAFAFAIREYDKKYPLIIDPPFLAYSTYLGGNEDYSGSGIAYDYGNGIAVDVVQNAYVTGHTASVDFPVQNHYQASYGGGNLDAFVTKLNSSGNALLYSTYLGGDGYDYGYGIAVDDSGNAYVAGKTGSDNFPVHNAYQESSGGSFDAFAVKLSPTGICLYSTYLGGSSSDDGRGIAVDDSGNAYLTGVTSSSNFPVQNAYQERRAGSKEDVFVTKLNSDGASLAYSTYLGGYDRDYGYGIAVDDYGHAYVTGRTKSDDFPLKNPYQESYGGGTYDVFVTKFTNSGSSLAYSTYLGGSNSEQGYGIAVDDAGHAYVTGYTDSTDFPIIRAFQANFGGREDAFVTKFSNDGGILAYSTYLGGEGFDQGYGIAVNVSGNAYVTGATGWSDFPLHNPYQATWGGGYDAFVTKLTGVGSDLAYSTYLGGTSPDYGQGIALDNGGNAYVTGYTQSEDFPLEDPYQDELYSFYDAFVARFNLSSQPNVNPTGTSTNLTGIPQVNTPITLTLSATGTGAFYYRFFIGTNYGAPWTQVQPWSTNGSCTHTPTSEGNNVFLAHMSDDPNSGSFHQAGFSFATSGHSEAGVVIYGLTTNLSMPQTVGTPINLTAQAYGTGTIFYKFWYKDDTGWHVIQDWSQNNMTTWTPPQAGTYTIVVWANTTPNDNIPNRPIAGFTFTVGG